MKSNLTDTNSISEYPEKFRTIPSAAGVFWFLLITKVHLADLFTINIFFPTNLSCTLLYAMISVEFISGLMTIGLLPNPKQETNLRFMCKEQKRPEEILTASPAESESIIIWNTGN